MPTIGSLVFCSDCGNLLNAGSGDEKALLQCDACGTSSPDTSAKVITTKSKPSAFPSSLRSKRSEVQTLKEDEIETTAVTKQTCEQCGREEVRFYTMQLRGADEGTTVFYICQCGHRWNDNN